MWHDALARYVNSDELAEGYDGSMSDTGTLMSNHQREFFSTHELLVKALHIDIGKVDRAGSMQKGVANAMKMLGFQGNVKWAKGRVRPRGYQRSLAPASAAPAAVNSNEVPEWE